jgi:peptidylprolyl isomerase
MRKLLAGLAALALVSGAAHAQAPAPAQPQPAAKPDPANTLVLELKTGKVQIKLRPDLAPKHVERVKLLASEKFYDGLKWHRVIEGFMAQSGDPKGIGIGGSKHPDLKSEFTNTPYGRGSVGAARTENPHSANSQFFICFGIQCRQLTGQYTLWGEVIEGMDHVDKIARGEPPSRPDTIIKGYLLSQAR